MSPNQYLVLGGAGFVGSAICRELDCRGIDNLPVGGRDYERTVGTDCEVLVNAAGNSRRFWANEHPAEDFEMTVRLAMRSLFDFRPRLYVLISSIDVYERFDDPDASQEDTSIDPTRLSAYGFHKWIVEAMVQRYAPSWLILRLGGLVGPGLKKNPVYDALHGEPLRITPDSTLGFINTDVAARALCDLAHARVRNEIFNVCGTDVISMRELAELSPLPVRFADGAQRQTYRVSNAKLAERMSIPSSSDAVRAYIRSVWPASPKRSKAD